MRGCQLALLGVQGRACGLSALSAPVCQGSVKGVEHPDARLLARHAAVTSLVEDLPQLCAVFLVNTVNGQWANYADASTLVVSCLSLLLSAAVAVDLVCCSESAATGYDGEEEAGPDVGDADGPSPRATRRGSATAMADGPVANSSGARGAPLLSRDGRGASVQELARHVSSPRRDVVASPSGSVLVSPPRVHADDGDTSVGDLSQPLLAAAARGASLHVAHAVVEASSAASAADKDSFMP